MKGLALGRIPKLAHKFRICIRRVMYQFSQIQADPLKVRENVSPFQAMGCTGDETLRLRFSPPSSSSATSFFAFCTTRQSLLKNNNSFIYFE